MPSVASAITLLHFAIAVKYLILTLPHYLRTFFLVFGQYQFLRLKRDVCVMCGEVRYVRVVSGWLEYFL